MYETLSDIGYFYPVFVKILSTIVVVYNGSINERAVFKLEFDSFHSFRKGMN